jgi:hypothetical protein
MLLNIFQAELHTMAYLTSDRYEFKESARRPFLIRRAIIKSWFIITVGEGEEPFRDSGWFLYLEVSSSCVAEGGVRLRG